MPTKDSKRVMEYRKDRFDQIGFLFEKPGRELLRLLALREGVGTAELLRRAALARGGLRLLPYPDQLADTGDIDTRKAAAAAIMRLQHEEDTALADELSDEPTGAEFTATISVDEFGTLEKLAEQISEAKEVLNKTIVEAGSPAVMSTARLTLTGEDVRTLRRILANMELC